MAAPAPTSSPRSSTSSSQSSALASATRSHSFSQSGGAQSIRPSTGSSWRSPVCRRIVWTLDQVVPAVPDHLRHLQALGWAQASTAGHGEHQLRAARRPAPAAQHTIHAAADGPRHPRSPAGAAFRYLGRSRQRRTFLVRRAATGCKPGSGMNLAVRAWRTRPPEPPWKSSARASFLTELRMPPSDTIWRSPARVVAPFS